MTSNTNSLAPDTASASPVRPTTAASAAAPERKRTLASSFTHGWQIDLTGLLACALLTAGAYFTAVAPAMDRRDTDAASRVALAEARDRVTGLSSSLRATRAQLTDAQRPGVAREDRGPAPVRHDDQRPPRGAGRPGRPVRPGRSAHADRRALGGRFEAVRATPHPARRRRQLPRLRDVPAPPGPAVPRHGDAVLHRGRLARRGERHCQLRLRPDLVRAGGEVSDRALGA
jgi:hypothetical protein